MRISEVSAARGIDKVMHFTTNRGVLGVLASGALKSRARLNSDDQLKHIFQPNAISRNKDIAWLDYVNLSVSKINESFFDICSENWHRDRDFWWAILEFSPEILTHESVYFSTTNNIYSGVKRGAGVQGLEDLFATRVTRWAGNVAIREAETDRRFPTCSQAEVLYPGQVSTEYLNAIHINDNDISDEVAAQIAAVGHDSVILKISPELFNRNLREQK